MNENVTAMACIDRGLGRLGVARNYNAAVGCIKAVAISFWECVFRGESGHGHIGVFIDHSRTYLMNVNFVRVPVIARLPCFRSYAFFDVVLPCRQNVIGHCLESFRTVDLERHFSSHNPRSQDEIGIADGVIRMQVSQKRNREVRRFQRWYSFVEHCCLGPPHNARAKIYQVGATVHNNCGGWTRPVWIRKRVPGSEQDYLRLAGWLISGEGRGLSMPVTTQAT